MEGKRKKLSGFANRKLKEEKDAKQKEVLKKIPAITSFFKTVGNTSIDSDAAGIEKNVEQNEEEELTKQDQEQEDEQTKQDQEQEAEEQTKQDQEQEKKTKIKIWI